MPGVPPSGAGQETNTGMGAVWIIAAVFVFLFGIWYVAHAQIVAGVFFIKSIELSFFQLFMSGLDGLQYTLRHTPPGQVDFVSFMNITSKVGYYLRFPVAVILVILAFLLWKKSGQFRFDHAYNMDSFLKAEIVNWPQSTPIIKKDLVHQDIDEGPWAMSMPPMRFAKKYKLLSEPKKEAGIGQLAAEARFLVSIVPERANRVFAAQLGRLYTDPDHLKPHEKALFAAFIARGLKDTQASEKLLMALSRASQSGSLNFSEVNHLIKKYGKHPDVLKMTSMHAHVINVLAGLLEFARTDGVLSTADFLWLKPIDRRLWFMLNTVGRRTACVEVSGVFAHYLVENKLKRKIKTPMVEEATRALKMAIQEMIYNPETAY